MIFKRRNPLSLLRRLRDFVAPRKGWRRGFAYVGRRVQRLPDTPHRIALGFACGVMASFTPLFTLHFIVAAVFALVVRGNVLASALGTFAGNPVTFPFIAGAALTLGNWMLGHGVDPSKFHVGLVFSNFDKFLDTIFWPYLLGGLAPGLVASGIVYALMRPLIAAYQSRRRLKLVNAAKRRVEARLRRPRPEARLEARLADPAE